jgi:hypothetical protein
MGGVAAHDDDIIGDRESGDPLHHVEPGDDGGAEAIVTAASDKDKAELLKEGRPTLRSGAVTEGGGEAEGALDAAQLGFRDVRHLLFQLRRPEARVDLLPEARSALELLRAVEARLGRLEVNVTSERLAARRRAAEQVLRIPTKEFCKYSRPMVILILVLSGVRAEAVITAEMPSRLVSCPFPLLASNTRRLPCVASTGRAWRDPLWHIHQDTQQPESISGP